MTNQSSPRRAAAFTLVELLVVLGIIATLIAILMPSLSRARERSNATVCMSNLRQIGLGVTMYANANGGRFPRNGHSGAEQSWLDTLQRHGVLPAVRLCPSDRRDLPITATSYLTNNYTVAPRPYTKVTTIRRTSVTIFSTEAHSTSDHLHATSYTTPASVANEIAVTRHNQAANYLFCDGHVESVLFERFRRTFTPETSPFNPITAQ